MDPSLKHLSSSSIADEKEDEIAAILLPTLMLLYCWCKSHITFMFAHALS